MPSELVLNLSTLITCYPRGHLYMWNVYILTYANLRLYYENGERTRFLAYIAENLSILKNFLSYPLANQDELTHYAMTTCYYAISLVESDHVVFF